MLGYNGGLRGKPRIPSTTSASGIWDLNEQKIAASAGIWPTIPAGEIPIASIAYSQSSVYSGVSPADNATMTNGSFVDSRTATNANGGLEWVQMDLGDIYQVGSVVIGTGTSNVPGGWNRTWSENRDIEYSSDGTNWTYAFTTPGIHGSESIPSAYPDNGIYTYPVNFSARYIRFSKGAGYGNWVLISEFYALAPGQIYDPYSDNVSLLLHMDGSNGSTTFTDSSTDQTPITSYGGAQISTAQSRFGGASGYFDGSNSYLTIPTNPNLLPGVADFTLEGWVYVSGNNNSGNTTNKTLFGTSWSGSTPSGSFILMLDGADNNRVLFLGWNTLALYSTTTLSTGQWYHLAVTNVSGTFRLFVNGVQEDSGTSSLNLNNNTSPIYIGRYVDPGQFWGFFNGYIDDLRVTVGVARYTSTFTPPTAPFPNF